MAVLRSGEIAPLQSPAKTLRKRVIGPCSGSQSDRQNPTATTRKERVIGPCTPSETREPLTQQQSSSSDTASPISSDPSPTNNTGLVLDLESVSEAPRRRSLRLASKSIPDEEGRIKVPDSISVSGGRRRKRKSVGGGESRNEDEIENDVGVSVTDVNEDKVCDLGAEKVRDLEMTSSGQKRKLEIDIGVSNVDLDDGEDNGAKQYWNLGSGKKVAKRRIEEQVESEGDKSVSGREDVGDDKEAERMLSDGIRLSSEEKGKEKAAKDGLAVEPSNAENSVNDEGVNGKGTVKGIKRFSRADKGKEKMVENDRLCDTNDAVGTVGLDSDAEGKNLFKNAVMQSVNLLEDVALEVESQILHVLEVNSRVDDSKRRDPMERFRNVARKNASRFAHFASVEEDEIGPSVQAEEAMPLGDVNEEAEDWPGPFSTAMKIIKDRTVKLNVQKGVPSVKTTKAADVLWVPKKNEQDRRSIRVPPSLQEKCMEILVKHADSIASFDNVPDVLRHKLSQMLCDSRRMSSHIFNLFICGSPTEVRVKDCSWLTEEDFTKSFEGCDTNNLMVLQLDQCGRCMPDYVVNTTLAQSSSSMPALTTLSLKGGCRLSDFGLGSLVTSAPALRSVNLSQCSLLTCTGIDTLADALGSILRELYIDDCQGIDAMLVLPALKKLEHLEVLSLAGIQTVSDDFIRKFMFVCGHNMKELVLTDCVKLTDSSLKVIAETCPGLCALDLANLCKLTDSAIGYISNSCLQIQTLKLRRNAFSDEAIAAFVETSGEFLKEFSLNNVKKVGHNTALSLARCSRNLQSLDLSFCRNMTDGALGLIVDSCLSLRLLKLFGCTQVSNVFLDGHSNPQVKIIGMKMTPILEHLIVPHPQEGPLQYSSVCAST